MLPCNIVYCYVNITCSSPMQITCMKPNKVKNMFLELHPAQSFFAKQLFNKQHASMKLNSLWIHVTNFVMDERNIVCILDVDIKPAYRMPGSETELHGLAGKAISERWPNAVQFDKREPTTELQCC